MEKINLAEKLALIAEHWRPKVVGELNGQEVTLVKFQGTFIDFRGRAFAVGPGELIIVRRGIEHRTVAAEEAEVLVFEPAATRNTGNIEDSRFTAPSGVRI